MKKRPQPAADGVFRDDPAGQHQEVKYPQVLRELADVIEAELKAAGIDDRNADRLAFNQVERIRRQFGGRRIYVSRAPSPRAHELDALATDFVRVLKHAGVLPEQARALAERQRCAIHRYLAGQRIYIPKGAGFERERKKRIVQARWDGTNTRALCIELKISDAYLRILFAEADAALTPRR